MRELTADVETLLAALRECYPILRGIVIEQEADTEITWRTSAMAVADRVHALLEEDSHE